jgi:ABC-type transport system substrate-binding protein
MASRAWDRACCWLPMRSPAGPTSAEPLTIVSQAPGYDAIDPAGAYISIWVERMIYDGLVTYRRIGGVAGQSLVPDLATDLPQPTDGGRTYTFTIRPGIRYSDGRLVLG